MTKLRGPAQKTLEAAARRGWAYSLSGSQFVDRWRWSANEPGHTPGGFHHPFGRSTGLGRYDKAGNVVSGTTVGNRPFWAFQFTYNEGEGPLHWRFRLVVFIYTAQRLPTVSVVPRAGLEPITAWFKRRAARSAEQNQDPRGRALAERFDGVKVGSEDFQRQFLVETADRRAAEWLLTQEIQSRLLVDGALSLASKGADVLCWCDPEPGAAQRLDYDLDRVDTMLELLDAVVLDIPQASRDDQS